MRKTFFVLALASLAYVACNKEKIAAASSTGSSNISAVVTDTIAIPINDLGKGTYYGFAGGLYPNSKNIPSGRYATDIQTFAASITPLDGFGNPSPNGSVGFLAVGGSTCAITMNALKPKTIGNPLTNPKLKLATLSTGGLTIDEVMNPADSFWTNSSEKLAKNELTPYQVEVIYLEVDDSTLTSDFPGRPLRAKDKMAQGVRTLKIKFPNVKLVYLMARTHTFLRKHKTGVNTHNVEPVPYYLGFTCKWLIEDQINGVAGLAYTGPNAVAPLVTWAFYDWADGSSKPRSDGFVWTKNLTLDGLHSNDEGSDTLTDRIQNFLFTDANANKWYANHTINK